MKTRYVTVTLTEKECLAILMALQASDNHPKNDPDNVHESLIVERGESKLWRALREQCPDSKQPTD